MSEQTDIGSNRLYLAYSRSGEDRRLKKKHIRQYRKDFVDASGLLPGMSVLELGCGNGLFLQFLNHIGITDFTGVDGDHRIIQDMPEQIAAKIHIKDFNLFFADHVNCSKYDRIIMIDVLEHFSVDDAIDLLNQCKNVTKDNGKIVIRVPNMGSPLGLNFQYGDLTHKTAFTTNSLGQAARIAGLEVEKYLPQTYSSWFKDVKEKALTWILSRFIAMPPEIWTTNLIAVLRKPVS